MKIEAPAHLISPLLRTRRTAWLASYQGSARLSGYRLGEGRQRLAEGFCPSASWGRLWL